jgi:serine/threonine-protein kinase
MELIAGGGFSAIYKARDLKDVPKAGPSAVKISRFNFRTVPRDLRVELNARMWREHEELVRLDHQNIVRIFEWGLHEAKVWYAMELLDGPTLGTYLAEERRTFLDLMLTYRQVLEAIAHCHSNGVVHRDLKPSNIIVTREIGSVVQKDDEDRSGGGDKRTPSERLKTRLAVLIDFGTGHLVGSPPVTAPGTLIGTAEYLPPWYVKQALAGKRLDRAYKAEPVDDVYQLGVLLYAMLTGVLPTRTSSAQPLRLLEEIRDVMPVHPRELNPEAPQALSDLAMRCLQKRSTRLPPDAAELRREWLEAMERDGEALRAKAPEFVARQETTMAETLGIPVSAPTVRDGPRSERCRCSRLPGGSSGQPWPSLARSSWSASVGSYGLIAPTRGSSAWTRPRRRPPRRSTAPRKLSTSWWPIGCLGHSRWRRRRPQPFPGELF